MEGLVVEQKSLRRRFEIHEKDLVKMLQQSPVDLELLEAQYNLFEEGQADLNRSNVKILEQMKADQKTEEEVNVEQDLMERFRLRFEIVKIRVKKLLRSNQDAETRSVTSAAVSGEPRRNFKLPSVEIKKFDGTRTEWLGFWAQFQRIHEDPGLDNSDKFWYLVNSLKNGSEAKELANLYPQSAENYPVVIEALKRRFGNENMLVQVYMRELLGLIISNYTTKDKMPFQKLFMKVDSHLRALKTLKLKERDPESWLYPLVESILPEQVLDNWQRSPLSNYDVEKGEPTKSRLDSLLEFMEKEVEIHQNIEFVKSFTNESVKGTSSKPSQKKDGGEKSSFSKKPPVTLATFHAQDKKTCAFCDLSNHASHNCYKAKKLPLEELRHILRKKGLCFNCFEPDHTARQCRSNVKCDKCSSRHRTIMCNQFSQKRRYDDEESRGEGARNQSQKRQKTSDKQGDTARVHVGLTQSRSAIVLSQTLIVKIVNGSETRNVRVFLDTGSKRSYISKTLAQELDLIVRGKEKVVHSLFGGVETEPTLHNKYNIKLKSLVSNFSVNLTVRDKDLICCPLERLSLNDQVIDMLKSQQIELTDVGTGSPPIDLLIGADFYGAIIDNGIQNLNNGLVAIKTKLGWTVIGEKKNNMQDSPAVSLCLSVHDKELPHLWDLELLGIRDPVEVMKGAELAEKVQQDFLSQVKRRDDGRYVVMLPWKEDHPPLPSNKDVAVKRLESTTKKLVENKLFDAYDSLFHDWIREGFIEKVNDEGGINTHYLPHRAVIKDSLTTPVRPVFDASCKRGKAPSLNDCLHKGCNFILTIPDILLRFRENSVGFTSDIRKAFQMIEVDESDRDCFRFLWWKSNKMDEYEIYRHVRVPFGATCSPFILGAILKMHLSSVSDEDKNVAEQLINNFYVDNCVFSVHTLNDYEKFKEDSIRMLSEAKMDLRMWLSSHDSIFPSETKVVSILGLLWEREDDKLFVDSSKLNKPEKLTKRTALSLLQRIFDPIGFTCPTTLPIKILLQKAWISKIKWDEILPEDLMKIFEKWGAELTCLSQIKVPRCFSIDTGNREGWSIHVFTDASQNAYATAIFIRCKTSERVTVQLLGAKSRVAPPKKITIPRLELLGSVIGTVLYSNMMKALSLDSVPVHFWCDSTTVLAWIRNNDQWGTYVGNRVKKILSLSRGEDWHYVPSAHNAADLPSRGCSPQELLQSQWWKGPEWLYAEPENWPRFEEIFNDDEVRSEVKVVKESVTVSIDRVMQKDRSYQSWINVTGWMKRFIFNCRQSPENRRKGSLSYEELKKAETSLLKVIQDESISESQVKKANLFETIRDDDGLLRVKTRIIQREDVYTFKYPVLLSGKHPIVRRMISDMHRANAHAGVGILLSMLRQKVWILQARRTVKKIVYQCLRCRRFSAKPTTVENSSLPVDRVKDADPFEVTGVDLAGPLYLRNESKVWIVIFTCANFRAVHLRIINSLSTKAFIQSLKEFCERYRRPAVIYSDNGTNFVGTNNLFVSFEFEETRKHEGLRGIDWKFNPSTASWWGGFFERLIRSTKDLMRRTLGNARVTRKELEALIWTVEKALNDRPLTYVSEDPLDLEPLTPNMFLHPFGPAELPEGELSEADRLRFRLDYVKTLRKHLMSRWRTEYLGLLVGKAQKPTRRLKVGDIVVVSTDNKKRIEWPLARILELYPSSSDGICRVAKIKTSNGILKRPVQRLHLLEADAEEVEVTKMKEVITRSGRIVKPPQRFK